MNDDLVKWFEAKERHRNRYLGNKLAQEETDNATVEIMENDYHPDPLNFDQK